MNECLTRTDQPAGAAAEAPEPATDGDLAPDPVQRLYDLTDTPERRELLEVGCCLLRRIPTAQLVPLVILLGRYSIDGPLGVVGRLALAEPKRGES